MPSKTRHIDPLPAVEPKPEAETQTEDIVIETLSDGKVRVTLRNEDKVTFKEPKVKQFLLMDSWAKDPENSMYSSETGITVKLCHLCIAEVNGLPFTLDFDTWIDDLDIRDMEALGSALATFRSVFEYLNRKAAEAEAAKKAARTTV
ncbi:hypothetical protein IQ273_12880 [Nodosilinea sp. LEGE 07298]|uniref:hypothetical protein n=1 Tax=Nodosilinea sp. LEGE 07298 TaxID=2777970 RepID=UPI001881286D|nr:hypothetical protein [Nodosilinea sp. LEGE 07298]MBE9110307.1 hypothetical protein [Nodosilinea sp. LEGE 07298]